MHCCAAAGEQIKAVVLDVNKTDGIVDLSILPDLTAAHVNGQDHDSGDSTISHEAAATTDIKVCVCHGAAWCASLHDTIHRYSYRSPLIGWCIGVLCQFCCIASGGQVGLAVPQALCCIACLAVLWPFSTASPHLLSSSGHGQRGAVLQVGERLSCVVQLLKDDYVVVSLPDHKHAIGYVSRLDYNLQGEANANQAPWQQGQRLTVVGSALPDDENGGRLILAYEVGGNMSALLRQSL